MTRLLSAKLACDAREVNVRELIELLNEAADHTPDGLDAEVVLHLCNGHDEPGVVTKALGLACGEPHDGRYARSVIVEGHPHLDDENTVTRPDTMGVDAELEQLVAGASLARPGVKLVLNETGGAVLIPYGEGGRLMLPGSPQAVAAGCACDPEKNNHGLGVHIEDSDRAAIVINETCPLHRRVPVDPRDVPETGD